MANKPKETYTGVEKHGNKLRIVFYYKKVKCHETLDLEPSPQNYQKASDIRDDVLSDIRRNKFIYREHFPNSKKATIFDLKPKSSKVKDLLEELSLNYLNSKKHAVNTKNDYIRYINNELIPAFGRYNIHELSPLVIKEWIENSTQTSKYVSNLLIPLRAMLNDAKNLGIIEKNPLDLLSLDRIFQTFDDHTDYEVKPFTPKEINTILSCEYSAQVLNLIRFGFYSGLRIGEILALKWENFDFETKKIKVEFTLVKNELHRPKTKSSVREIVLINEAFQAVVNQMQHTKNHSEFIFNNPNTEDMWSSTDAFRKHWVKVLQKAKIQYRNPYQMRHTFASTMLTKKEPALKVSKYLGHKNIEMVNKIYGTFVTLDESEENSFKEE